MTTTNTTYRQKGHAVFLAAIMVLSMVAMSAAFAAPAAAASTNGNFDTVSPVVAEETEHSFNVTGATGDDVETSSLQNITVNYTADADVDNADNLVDGLTADNVTVANNSGSLDIGSVDASGSTITIDLENDAQVANSEDVNVTIEDAQNPDTVDDHDVEVRLGATNGNEDTVTFTGANGLTTAPALSVSPEDAVAGTNEEVEYTVSLEDGTGAAIAGQTVEYTTGPSDGPNATSDTATTDANGEVTFAIANSAEASETLTFTEQQSGLDTTVDATLFTTDQGTAFIDGDVGDTQLNPIADDGDIEITVNSDSTNLPNPVIDNVELSEFDNLASQNPYVASAGFTSGDVSEGDRGEYFLELETQDENVEYEFVADLENFDAFDGNVTVGPGDQGDRNIRLTRQVDADRLTVTDPASSPTSVDIENTVDVTTFVEEADTPPVGDFDPFQDESITASVAAADVDDPSGTLDETNVQIEGTPQPSSNTSDANGNAVFTVGLDLAGNSPEDFTQPVEVDVTFTADSNASTTATQTIVFQPDPRGTGAIQGDVTEIDSGIELGVQSANAEAAAGVPVHAVQFTTVAQNTDAIPETEVDAGDQFRVVTYDEEGEPITEDVRNDYLVTTNESVVAQNTTTQGFDVESVQNNGFDAVNLHFLRPDDYQVQSYDAVADSWNNVSTADNTVANDLFNASEDLRYDAVDDRFENASAVPTDVTGSDGEFSLFELPAEEAGTDYVVIAGDGYDTGNDQTELGFANFGGFDVVTVEPAADAGASQVQSALRVQEFETDQVVDYRLDVTVNESKFEAVGTGSSTSVEVTAESKLQQEAASEYDAAANVNLSLERIELANEPQVDNLGELEDTVVETNEDGVATTTFTANPSAQASVGDLNISAELDEANSEGEVFQTQGSEQATIEVFDAGEITGDVVNEDNENLGGSNPAEVELYNRNDLTTPIQTTTAGPQGSYTFSDVRTGEDYRMIATFNDEDGFADVDDLGSGTTTADVVITGVEAPEGFNVNSVTPQDGTVTQGQSLDVEAEITNTGTQDTQDVTLELENETGDIVFSEAQSVTLGAGATETVTFTLGVGDTSGLSPGDYTHRVVSETGANAEGSLTVEGFGSTAVATYGDESGEIDDTDVAQAVQDWSNEEGWFAQSEDPDTDIAQIVQAWANANN